MRGVSSFLATPRTESGQNTITITYKVKLEGETNTFVFRLLQWSHAVAIRGPLSEACSIDELVVNFDLVVSFRLVRVLQVSDIIRSAPAHTPPQSNASLLLGKIPMAARYNAYTARVCDLQALHPCHQILVSSPRLTNE